MVSIVKALGTAPHTARMAQSVAHPREPPTWPTAALTPSYLRGPSPSALPPLTSEAAVRNLSILEARSLTGPQIDAINRESWHAALGSRWLMREQECEYNPPASEAAEALDVAVLMVDDRPPLAYRIPGTPFASPPSWGLPRTPLSRDFVPPRWGPMSVERANSMAAAAIHAAGRVTANAWAQPMTSDGDDSGDGDGAGAGGAGDETSDDDNEETSEAAFAIGGGSSSTGEPPRVSGFQLALIINHVFATLHGHAFYLEAPCVNATTGVDESMWERSVSAALRRSSRGAFTSRHRKYLKRTRVCGGLSAAHKLGPFPPRPAAWAKLAAIRYVARRHAFVLYVDSDAFVTKVWQPISPLISLLGMRRSQSKSAADTWLVVAGEYPPQKLRRDARAGEANSGVLLLAGVPTAGPGVLTLLEDWIWPTRGVALSIFNWPFEQNALSTTVLKAYAGRIVQLRPGCPLNSPFGAYVRHYVGGTPDRSVYHPDHRASWLLQALRCTVGLVADAVAGGGAATADNEALRRREGCAPNEPTLTIDAGGACDSGGVHYRGVAPAAGGSTVLSRVGASWWRACCALCHQHAACGAWAFDEAWPADSRNCVLLDGFNATRRAEDSHIVGRILLARGAGFGGLPHYKSPDKEEPLLVTYVVPTVGPWER